jgi:tetraacyldisaccharide 4'-kinase
MERWVERKQSNIGFSFVTAALYLMSRFFKLAVRFRHLLYQAKVFSASKATIPIISVGNIVCGGTGKSEFVAKLISDLEREDIAILTRGYRSKRKGKSRKVADVLDGDEPFMLQQRCKKNPVIIGKKREESAALAALMGCKACILDDGMQYLKLEKDIQIVMIRAEDPFSQGFVPFGMRRELLSKLKGAHYIVIHGAESESKYELVKRELLCYSSGKYFGTKYCLEKNRHMAGKKVGVFCGIGNPHLFINGLKSLGLTIVKNEMLSDHQKLPNGADFFQSCKTLGAELIVCTEKDFVKLTSEEKAFVFPIEISMNITYDEEVYQSLVTQIRCLIENTKEKDGK